MNDTHANHARRYLLLLSLLWWGLSLVLPAVDVGPMVVRGWQFLLRGWRGLLEFNIGGLSWLANPLLIGSWVALLLRHDPLARRLAWCALVAALTSFLFNVLSSADALFVVEAFAMGFYLWLASVLVQVIACYANVLPVSAAPATGRSSPE